MADEVTTDATNSETANQTDASVTTDNNSSATTQTDGEADALDGASILGDAEVATGDGDDDEKPGVEGGEGDEAAGTDKEAAKVELFGAPEGDYELTGLPEGMVIDTDALAAVAPLAKEMNLSNDGLSKLAGVYAEKVLPGVLEKATQDFTGSVVAVRRDWDQASRAIVSGGEIPASSNAFSLVKGAEVKDGDTVIAVKVAPDPIFGGKSFEQVTAIAAKAIDRFGGPEYREYLKDTGQGNDPRMLKFAYQAGSLIAEDTSFERAGGTPNTPKTREEKYYGDRAG